MAARKKSKNSSQAKTLKRNKESSRKPAASAKRVRSGAVAKSSKKPAPKAATSKTKAKTIKAKTKASTKPASKSVKVKSVQKAPVAAAKPVVKPVAAVASPVAAAPKVAMPSATVQKPAVAVKPAAAALKPAAPAPSVAPAAVSPAAAPIRPSPPMGYGVRPGAPPAPGRPMPPRGYQRPIDPNAKNAPRPNFKLDEFVVYPAHGVGRIIGHEEQEVAGFKLELFVIHFPKEKLTLRVPLAKVVSIGMRRLSEPDAAQKALELLTGRARIKRTMWSRRAQEYEGKINSGDIRAIAEVVRDLYRSEAQPEQSYSERQLYEAALDRLVREIAAVQKLEEIDAVKLVEQHLKRGPRRPAKGEAESSGEPDAATDVEQAA